MGMALPSKHHFGFNDLSIKGDLLFEPSGTGKGLIYGNISVKDNTDPTILNSAAKVQITDFDTDGPSNGATPVNAQDHIVINSSGVYWVVVSVHLNNNAAQAHLVDVSAWKNNGTVELEAVHGHRSLAGGSGDVGSMSMSGPVELSVGDTLEVWGDTSEAADRSVTFEDVSLTIVKIGG